MNKVLISDMSWVEFRDVMATNDLVIIPVGSIEEHGPHNPLGTDMLIARAAARAIGAKAQAPVAPVMPVGNARNLAAFPGTATIDPELLRQVMVQLCEAYIRHGAKRFLFINGHGGNTATLKRVSADLYARHKAIATQTEWWLTLPRISEYPCNDHGGKYETSMVMAVDEGLVNMAKAVTVPRKNLSAQLTFSNGLQFRGAKLTSPVPLDRLTPMGNYGAEAEQADVRMGRKMFDVYVDYCAGLVEELRKIHL
jgi:creatinine amidohydrolase